jgi:hypothetical protein
MNDSNLPWTDDKLKITDAYFEAINKNNLELFRIIKLHLRELDGILPILEFIVERLETVATLTVENRIWDAEIILRSAIETFVKYVFITTADKDEREKRLDEFWNLLAEVNSLKQSEQAKKNLIHLGKLETHNLAYSPMLLTEVKETELRTKWTKAERQKLEQKWSFTEIVNSLSKNYRGKPMEIFITLTHGYRMSSHVTHGDETGILIIRERNSRSFEDRELAYFTHYLRLLSDVFTFCAFMGVETMNLLGLDKDFFFKNQETLKDIQMLTEKYHSDLFKDKDYDKYRK